MDKYIVVLGSGIFQVPLIKHTKSSGFKTIVVSNCPGDLGMQLADIAVPVSYTEVERVYEVLKPYKVLAVLSCASEAVLPFQAKLCERLKLPFRELEFINQIINKRNFKDRLLELRARTPQLFEIDEMNNLIKDGNTFIAKPVVGSGSERVEIISGKTDLKRFNKSDYLIEAFINGSELGGDLFVYQGKVVFFQVTEKYSNKYLVPNAHLVVSSMVDYQSLSFEFQQVVDGFPLKDGFYNFDLIKDREGSYYIIDFGARIGGNCIPLLINLSTGINEFDVMLKCALGEELHITSRKSDFFYGVYILGAEKEGRLNGYNTAAIHDLESSGQLEEYLFSRDVGEDLGVFKAGNKNAGYIIFKSRTVDDLRCIHRKIAATEWLILK
ncbi:ATP-grasp domain-containing protein [bacterium]|nr:ATP-grasp domain-containing protein [bacterium]